MRIDDSTNFHTFTYNGGTHYNVWNFGRETWCNLEGRFMHIVADLLHLAG